MQKWMDSVPGQTFLNYAYSWGAAVVILGTLFKLTHLPGANVMLFIGMGTEVFVFFISAFDRPFDKSTIDMTLDNHMSDEVIDEVTEDPFAEPGSRAAAVAQQVAPVVTAGMAPVSVVGGQQGPVAKAEPVSAGQEPAASGAVSGGIVAGGVSPAVSGGTIIIGGIPAAGTRNQRPPRSSRRRIPRPKLQPLLPRQSSAHPHLPFLLLRQRLWRVLPPHMWSDWSNSMKLCRR